MAEKLLKRVSTKNKHAQINKTVSIIADCLPRFKYRGCSAPKLCCSITQNREAAVSWKLKRYLFKLNSCTEKDFSFWFITIHLLRIVNCLYQGVTGYTVEPAQWPHSKRPKIGFQDQLSLNAGQKYSKGSILQYF